tara:strand:+ start:31228 stop:31683 length:456 start_codon:yes stop_codon:yes gene_type:complete
MSKFAHLKSLAVNDGDTVEFSFYEIEGVPTLDVAPATKANREFFNAVLRKSKEAARKLRSRRNQMPTQAQIDAVRREDVALFSEYIVKGWRNVVDSKGTEVEFSKEDCQEWLMEIPDDMFEELRDFCLDIRNFRQGSDEMEAAELEDLTGN